jgi:hypothetical protein
MPRDRVCLCRAHCAEAQEFEGRGFFHSSAWAFVTPPPTIPPMGASGSALAVDVKTLRKNYSHELKSAISSAISSRMPLS